MKKENNQPWDFKLIAWAAVVILFILLFFGKKDDIGACRDLLYGLTKGTYYSVDRYVSWEHLQAVGVDVAGAYSQLPNEKEKLNYRRAFFKSFAEGFRLTGGKFEAFSNWRFLNKDSQKTVVAADYKGKILLFTLDKKYAKKVTGIQWQ